MLAVLIERRGADNLQFAAGHHGLEQRRRIQGAFGGARADERVDLVDEEHDVAPGVDLLEDLLHAILEIAAVARARDERPHVEGVQLLVFQRLRHVAGGDGLRKPFDDGGLADAGLADQHGIVLRAPGEHLHDALGLHMASDDRVELVVASGLCEVASVLVEDRRAGLRPLAGASAYADGLLALEARDELIDLRAHARHVGPELRQDLCGHAVGLARQTEQKMLGADVGVTQLKAFAHCVLDDLLGSGREGNVARGRLLAFADDVDDLSPDLVERDVEGF